MTEISNANTLRDHVRTSPQIVFFIMLVLYLSGKYFLIVSWNEPVAGVMFDIYMVLKCCAALCLAIQTSIIFFKMCRSYANEIIISVAASLLGVPIFLSAVFLENRVFTEWFFFALILMAYGKSFRKIVTVYLYAFAAVVIVAAAGLPIGLTYDTLKEGDYGTGFSFGMIHANVFAMFVLGIFLAAWYLFLRQKPVLYTCIISWALAVLIFVVPKSRTTVLLLIIFPLAVFGVRVLAEKCRAIRSSNVKKLCKWLLALLPVFCFALTIILGIQREWLVQYTYDTYIENFSKRFIQSGIAFHEHGFPLIGEDLHLDGSVWESLAGLDIPLYLVDNGYAAFGILYGMIWLGLCLACLVYLNHRAIREHNYDILVISIVMTLLSLMERPGMEIWYNFVFLYALSQVDDDLDQAETVEESDQDTDEGEIGHMDPNKAHIVYSSDENYGELVGVSLTSLLENSKDMEDIRIHILDLGIRDQDKERIGKVCSDYGRPAPEWFSAEDIEEILEMEVYTDRGTVAQFARIFISRHIDPQIERVLYLDCDTIIRKSIKELWNLDLEGKTAAVLKDAFSRRYRKNIDLEPDDIMFNSGVMLIDMHRWREQEIEKRILAFIEEKKGFVEKGDQGALNAVLSRDCICFDPIYNAVTIFFDFTYEEMLQYRQPPDYYSKEEIKRAVQDPTIIHYTLSFLSKRPWEKRCRHPWVAEWLKYKELSLWRDEPLWVESRSSRVYVMRFLPRKVMMAAAGALQVYGRPKLYETRLRRLEKQSAKNDQEK